MICCSAVGSVAFDLLWCTGKDLRRLPLIERKLQILSVVRENAERIP